MFPLFFSLEIASKCLKNNIIPETHSTETNNNGINFFSTCVEDGTDFSNAG
jgi:hypothetical protein